MGGFSTQVQSPQSSQPGGKSGPIGQAVAQAATQPVSDSTAAVNKSVISDDFGSNNMPRPMGKGGRQTNSATSGQPQMCAPNQYSNTVGQWDNTQIQPLRQQGKGKGA